MIRASASILLLALAGAPARTQEFDPEAHKVIRTDRTDGRHLSTRGLVQHRMRNARPKLAFNPNFTRPEFERWQIRVREKLRELMRYPEPPEQPAPKLLSRQKRDGYTLERWEAYPLPGGVVPYLMLVPDSASAWRPAPAVLCFPGSAGSKENLAGEPEINPLFARPHVEENRQALYYAKQGIVAVAVDNPGVAETSDLEKFGRAPNYERDTLSRYLLDTGWHYLGLSSFQSAQILKWMRTRDFIDPRHIALSGHSLGTEPLMALAATDAGLQAFVFNDHLCRLITRAVVTSKPSKTGLRPISNWLGHCVPGLWEWLDYPDIVASLAPRPLIITEGGAAADLDLVKKAYRIAGAPDNISVHHYPKYRDASARLDYAAIPEGLDQTEWFRYVNVDAPNHYFKANIAVPWLAGVLFR